MKSKALTYALRLLKIRFRTIKELEQRLKLKGYQEREITDTIKILKKERLLDDKRFAQNYSDYLLRCRPMGRYRLKLELIKRGIQKDLAESSIGNLDKSQELAMAQDLVSRRLKLYRGLARGVQYRRLAGFLGRRGFSSDIISQVLKEML